MGACEPKTGFITGEVYCAAHGRAAGWPCSAPEQRENDYEPDVPVKAHCIHMLDCGCRPPFPEPREDVAVAEVLAAHEADVTSYDAGDLWGCRCGWELTASQRSHDYDGDKWADYRAHVAIALAPLIAERVREAVESARDESAVAEVGLTDAEWTRLRHAAGNRGDLGPIAEEVERILGERVSGDEAAIRQEREHCDQANRRADRWRERCDEARTCAANLEAERDALAAKVARAYALADVWEAENHPTSTIIARELRAALGDQP